MDRRKPDHGHYWNNTTMEGEMLALLRDRIMLTDTGFVDVEVWTVERQETMEESLAALRRLMDRGLIHIESGHITLTEKGHNAATLSRIAGTTETTGHSR